MHHAQMKKFLWGLFAVVMVVMMIITFVQNPATDHIEDTNGADNYALQTITERDVVEKQMGSRGGPNIKETTKLLGVGASDKVTYSASKFTGVYAIYTTRIFKGSDIVVDLPTYTVKGGNFAFYIVFDDQVVGQVQPNEFGGGYFEMKDIKKSGSLEYIIAGESAEFEFLAPSEW